MHPQKNCLISFLFLLCPLAITPLEFDPKQQQQQQSTEDKDQQQQQTPVEYAYIGKNIRFETQPMRFFDSKGNQITASQAGSKTDYCVDIDGKKQPNGAEYQRQNKHFFFRCNDGNEEVTACVGTARTQQARIPVGESTTVNGFWHKCERMANGSVMYTEANSCQYAGTDYTVGSEFMMGPIKMLCMDGGIQMIGCIYEAKSGERISMAPGENRTVNNVRYFCNNAASQGPQQQNQNPQQQQKQAPQTQPQQRQQASPSGDSRPQPQQQQGTPFQCNRDGRQFTSGESYQANHIRYRCDNGFFKVIGCYSGTDQPMDIGQDVSTKNMVYRCYKVAEGPTVEYTEYTCGYRGGPSCTTSPVSQQQPQASSSSGNSQQQQSQGGGEQQQQQEKHSD